MNNFSRCSIWAALVWVQVGPLGLELVLVLLLGQGLELVLVLSHGLELVLVLGQGGWSWFFGEASWLHGSCFVHVPRLSEDGSSTSPPQLHDPLPRLVSRPNPEIQDTT